MLGTMFWNSNLWDDVLKNFKTVSRAVLSITRQAIRYVYQHPMQALSSTLAFYSPKALAEPLASRQLSSFKGLTFNTTVGEFFQEDVTDYFGCNILSFSSGPNPYISVCPNEKIAITDISSFYPQYPYPHWVSFLNNGQIYLQGTPTVSDRFLQGIELNVYIYNCSYPYLGDLSTCPDFTTLTGLFSFYTQNLPPYISLPSQPIVYPSLQAGLQPITSPIDGSLQPFSGSFFQDKIASPQGDMINFKLFSGNQTASYGATISGHSLLYSRVNMDSASGQVTIYPAPGDEGKHLFDIFASTPFNQKSVPDYEGHFITAESYLWTQSYIQILNSAPNLNSPLFPTYATHSFQTLSFSISQLCQDPHGNKLHYQIRSTNNTTEIPDEMVLTSSGLLFSFTPTPDQRGDYNISFTCCNQPSKNCQLPSCIPADPLCLDTPSTKITVLNSAPIWNNNLPSQSGMINHPIIFQVQPQDSSDPDLDPGLFSIRRIDGNQLMPAGFQLDNTTGSGQWTPIPGTMIQTYQFKIRRTDLLGASAETSLFISLAPQPPIIHLPPTTLIDTQTGISGQICLTPPYENPDLLPTQNQAFQQQTLFNLNNLPSHAVNITYQNQDCFLISYQIPNTNPGTYQIGIFHPQYPSVPLSSNIQATSPGPQLLKSFTLMSGPTDSYFISPSFSDYFANTNPNLPLNIKILNLPSPLLQNQTHIYGPIQPLMAGNHPLTITATESGIILTAIGSLQIPRSQPVLNHSIAPFTVLINPNLDPTLPEETIPLNPIDPDGFDDLTCKLSPNANAATDMLQIQDCIAKINVRNGNQGNYSIPVTIKNSARLGIQTFLNFTVPNQALIFSNIKINGAPKFSTNFSIETDTASLIDFSAGAYDPDGGTPSFSFSQKPNYCTPISLAIWQCIPTESQAGMFNFSGSWDNGFGDQLTESLRLTAVTPTPNPNQGSTSLTKAALGIGSAAIGALIIISCAAYGCLKKTKERKSSMMRISPQRQSQRSLISMPSERGLAKAASRRVAQQTASATSLHAIIESPIRPAPAGIPIHLKEQKSTPPDEIISIDGQITHQISAPPSLPPHKTAAVLLKLQGLENPHPRERPLGPFKLAPLHHKNHPTTGIETLEALHSVPACLPNALRSEGFETTAQFTQRTPELPIATLPRQTSISQDQPNLSSSHRRLPHEAALSPEDQRRRLSRSSTPQKQLEAVMSLVIASQGSNPPPIETVSLSARRSAHETPRKPGSPPARGAGVPRRSSNKLFPQDVHADGEVTGSTPSVV